MHGARKPKSIKRGADCPAFKHGGRTRAAEIADSHTAYRLRELEDMARAAGLLTGPRTRGRKPKTN